MKQIGIRLEEELIQNAKMFALKHGLTLQDLVANSLSSYIDNNLTTTTPNTKEETPKNAQKTLPQTPKSDNIVVEEPKKEEEKPKPTYDPTIHYLIRKTHKTKLDKSGGGPRIKGNVQWWLSQDVEEHYDKDGNVIPYRFSQNGVVYDLDDDDIKEIEENTGKKVIFE